MKTSSNRIGLRSGSTIAGLALAAALLPTVAKATTITLTPTTQNVNVGNPFDLALRVTGLGDHSAPSLGAFDLDITFNSILAQFDSVTFGDPSLGDVLGPVTPSFNLSTSGLTSVNVFGFSNDSPGDLDLAQTADFTLATFHFTALASGSGSFDIANIILGDADGAPLTLDEFQGATINIRSQSVPEGGVGWMGVFTIGALTLGHRRLRRRQTSS